MGVAKSLRKERGGRRKVGGSGGRKGRGMGGKVVGAGGGRRGWVRRWGRY